MGHLGFASVFCLLLSVGVATSADVCEDCKCRREEGGGGTHYDIRCDCDGEILQDLNFTRDYMKFREDKRLSSLPTVALTVSGCRRVRFESDLLLMATRVDVRDVSSLTVAVESLVAVDDLEVRHVEALRLEPGAFFGHNVSSLVVEDSSLEPLEALTLVAVQGLRSLQLTRVTVEALETNAVIITMLNLSQVVLRDTVIREVKQDGFFLNVTNFTVVNSSFGNVENEGINVSSPLMRLTNNTFRNLEGPRSLCLHGGQARVTGNRFSSFPDCLFTETNLQGLEFVGNEFQFQISQLPVESLANVTEKYSRNGFQCACSDDFGRSVSVLRDSGYGPLLNKTFCASQLCPLSVTHGQLLSQFQGNWSECALEERCVTSSSSSAFSALPFPLVAAVVLQVATTICNR